MTKYLLCLGLVGAPFVGAAQDDKPSYPWVVFGRVTDAKGNAMPGVTIGASCGRGSLMPTGSTQSDAQGDYRMSFGPGRVVKTEAGRLDLNKTIEHTALQAAVIGPSKPGYYERNLGRQGDLRMACELPSGAATENVILPNQPRRIDFVMLPAAAISGRVVDADGKAAKGARLYVVSDRLPPAATVFCEFRTNEKGAFEKGDVPCQSYWFRVADGKLAGLRSNPVAISEPGNYEVEVLLNAAERKLEARIVRAPVRSPGE